MNNGNWFSSDTFNYRVLIGQPIGDWSQESSLDALLCVPPSVRSTNTGWGVTSDSQPGRTGNKLWWRCWIWTSASEAPRRTGHRRLRQLSRRTGGHTNQVMMNSISKLLSQFDGTQYSRRRDRNIIIRAFCGTPCDNAFNKLCNIKLYTFSAWVETLDCTE